MLTLGSLFCGIGGFDLAAERNDIDVRWQVEIDKDCNKVLAHHWPGVTRYGDIREVDGRGLESVDIISGGVPCQPASVAGKRQGASDDRWLWPEFFRIVGAIRPAYVLWENPAGLLSLRAEFLSILTALADLGYSGGYSLLDSQWFGVPQRRQRLFGLFARRDIGARRCAEILSITPGSPRYSPPSREAGQRVAVPVRTRTGTTGSPERGDDTLIAHTLRAEGADASEDGTGRGVPMVTAFDWQAGHGNDDSFRGKSRQYIVRKGDYTGSLQETKRDAIQQGMVVRRLTPLECLRLQAFPDDWFDGTGLSDSAQYRCLGNAVTVSVVQWLLGRLVEVQSC